MMKKNKTVMALLMLILFSVMIMVMPGKSIYAEDAALIDIQSDYSVFNRKAAVSVKIESKNDIVSLKYVKGKIKSTESTKWTTKAKDITGKDSFTVKKSGNYSIIAEDSKGNKVINNIKITLEFKAVWFAYYDYLDERGRVASSEADFTAKMDKAFLNVKNMGMNAVVVHVRSHSDAMYDSKYFPWSRYASGTQGVDPGYDPLKIMISIAHKYGLEFHAWLNPYRIATRNTDIKSLAADNPARVWLEDDNPDNDRNVLAFGGNLYYNPASSGVRKLIINGIKEIVKKYDVDGIHFDDYFYPEYIGSEYKTLFDAEEYKVYEEAYLQKGKTNYMDIVTWRRNNVNKLLSGIYKAVKKIDSSVVFGVSPGGYLDHLTKVDRNYVDYPTWLSKNGYIDYICPQVYWSFDENNTFPYSETVDRWIAARSADSNVNIYIGIAVYKAGAGIEEIKEDGWQDTDILKNMIITARKTKKIDGFLFFDYSDMVSKNKAAYVGALLDELN